MKWQRVSHLTVYGRGFSVVKANSPKVALGPSLR